MGTFYGDELERSKEKGKEARSLVESHSLSMQICLKSYNLISELKVTVASSTQPEVNNRSSYFLL